MAEPTPLRVLHVEDREPDSQLVARALRRAGYAVQIRRVMTASEMQAALRDADWEAVISDYNLPKFDALDALSVLQESGLDLPFIIVSGTIDEVEAVTALRAGAHDFITKANLARLAPAIERELREAENRRLAQQTQTRLKATMDVMLEGAQIIGFDWRYIYVNDAAIVQNRQPREALLGRTMMQAYPGFEKTAIFAALQRCQEQRTPVRVEEEFVYPDGSTGWFDISIQPVADGIFLLSQDITQRKQAEVALQRSHVELTMAYDATIEGWSRALDLRDKETEGHSQRVTELTLKLARAYPTDDAELVHVRRGALLHDIGKMGIPDHILLKPGPLTEDEWVIMRRHPAFAHELLSPIDFLRPALDIPYCHHEKWDGMGYPRGLAGEQIPLAARLFAVVDVWDALRSDRPYRPAWPPEKVRAHIQSLAGIHFEPRAVKIFLQVAG